MANKKLRVLAMLVFAAAAGLTLALYVTKHDPETSIVTQKPSEGPDSSLSVRETAGAVANEGHWKTEPPDGSNIAIVRTITEAPTSHGFPPTTESSTTRNETVASDVVPLPATVLIMSRRANLPEVGEHYEGDNYGETGPNYWGTVVQHRLPNGEVVKAVETIEKYGIIGWSKDSSLVFLRGQAGEVCYAYNVFSKSQSIIRPDELARRLYEPPEHVRRRQEEGFYERLCDQGVRVAYIGDPRGEGAARDSIYIGFYGGAIPAEPVYSIPDTLRKFGINAIDEIAWRPYSEGIVFTLEVDKTMKKVDESWDSYREKQQAALDLYFLSVRDGRVTKLTNDPTQREGYPACSPDGKRVTFPSYNEENGTRSIKVLEFQE